MTLANRHRCSAGLLFSHLAEPSNRYCICCQRSPVWRIDTAQGTWGEFDLPSGHRMGTSSGKSPQELSAWKENETQDVSLKGQNKLKSPLKSPNSERFAIVWVRNSFEDSFAGVFNENLILILEGSYLLIADFNDNIPFSTCLIDTSICLSFKGLWPLRLNQIFLCAIYRCERLLMELQKTCWQSLKWRSRCAKYHMYGHHHSWGLIWLPLR